MHSPIPSDTLAPASQANSLSCNLPEGEPVKPRTQPRHGVGESRLSLGLTDDEREAAILCAGRAIDKVEMVSMHRQGVPIKDIAALRGITSAGVRIALKRIGLTAKDGGSYKKSNDRTAIGNERKAILARYPSLTPDASRKYTYQADMARRRGIEWRFTFETWCSVWEESGLWSKRGRAEDPTKCYVMCRCGDVGPYEPGNVYIGTVAHNASSMRRRTGMGKGWRLMVGQRVNRYAAVINGKYLGSFPTIEAARAAYLEAAEKINAERGLT